MYLFHHSLFLLNVNVISKKIEVSIKNGVSAANVYLCFDEAGKHLYSIGEKEGGGRMENMRECNVLKDNTLHSL